MKFYKNDFKTLTDNSEIEKEIGKSIIEITTQDILRLLDKEMFPFMVYKEKKKIFTRL